MALQAGRTSEKDQAAEHVKMELRKLKANFLASHPEGHAELTTVFADIAALTGGHVWAGEVEG